MKKIYNPVLEKEVSFNNVREISLGGIKTMNKEQKINEVLEEFDNKFDKIRRKEIGFYNSNISPSSEKLIKTFLKQKLQDQQKLNNSGRKMYQQGQKDERGRIIEMVKALPVYFDDTSNSSQNCYNDSKELKDLIINRIE